MVLFDRINKYTIYVIIVIIIDNINIIELLKILLKLLKFPVTIKCFIIPINNTDHQFLNDRKFIKL